MWQTALDGVECLPSMCSGRPPSLVSCAESFVYALGSVPDVKLRLDVLKLHHTFHDELPKKVGAALGCAVQPALLPAQCTPPMVGGTPFALRLRMQAPGCA